MITPMITAYDWMKAAREQNNFQKDSGEFSRTEEMTRKPPPPQPFYWEKL